MDASYRQRLEEATRRAELARRAAAAGRSPLEQLLADGASMLGLPGASSSPPDPSGGGPGASSRPSVAELDGELELVDAVASSAASSSPPRRPPAKGKSRRKPLDEKERARRRARRARLAVACDAGGAKGCRPRDFRREVLGGVPSIMTSLDGRVARDRLCRLPGWLRWRVHRLALFTPDGRQLPDSLQHVWSRWIVALAFLLWRSRRKAGRNGFEHVVDGYTQRMICRLFVNPQTGRFYSRSRIFGTKYSTARPELCGPMTALRRAGLYWRQPRSVDANPRYLGRARTRTVGGVATTFRPAFAVYWLSERPPAELEP